MIKLGQGQVIKQAHVWEGLVKSRRLQLYVSRSRDPWLNLAIEHYILMKSAKETLALFLYVNKPCVVIGRNQNPWQEVNMNRIVGQGTDRPVPMIRRRSGGGAVFHDEGNLNYSVICPSSKFTRRSAASMVASAVRKFNERAEVNERFDIVLQPNNLDVPLKISGSAYKLKRDRSLHHGTCLVRSSNLGEISQYLSAPARGFIKSGGVESVRSPVGNVFPEGPERVQDLVKSVRDAIVSAFLEREVPTDSKVQSTIKNVLETADRAEETVFTSGNDWAAGVVAEDITESEDVGTFMRELQVSICGFEPAPRNAGSQGD